MYGITSFQVDGGDVQEVKAIEVDANGGMKTHLLSNDDKVDDIDDIDAETETDAVDVGIAYGFPAEGSDGKVYAVRLHEESGRWWSFDVGTMPVEEITI